MTYHAFRQRGARGNRMTGLIDPKALGMWTPANLTDLVYWIDLSDANYLFTDAGITKVSSNGDLVYQAHDKSGNGYHFSQSDSAKRPIYRPSIGNKGSVEFVPNDLLVYPSVILGLTSTIFGVIYLSSTSEMGVVMGVGRKDTGYCFGVGGTNFDNLGNNFMILFGQVKWIDPHKAIGLGTHLITLKMSSGVPTYYLDGVYLGTTSGTPSTPLTGIYIGGEGENRYFTDHITELVVCDAALSDDDREITENYLMDKHGIS